jgi:hypothetical protein
MILLKSGETERVMPVIGKAFSEVDYSNIGHDDLEKYCETVMALNTPKAWETIAMLFDDIGLASLDEFDGVACCRALESHGYQEGLKYYRALLDNRETGIPNMVGWGRQIAFMFGDKLLEGYADHDEVAKKILADTKEDSAERLKATKSWLDARLAKMKGKGD